MKKHVITLTVNRRAANHLISQYEEKQSGLGKQAWHLPNILFIDDWIHSIWLNNLNDGKKLLSNNQSLFLWKNIVSHSKKNHFFVKADTVAHNMQKAFKSMKQWNLSVEQFRHYPLNEMSAYFLDCLTIFEKKCRDNYWITQSELIDLITSNIEKIHHVLPKQINLIGFDELNPSLDFLLKKLSDYCLIKHEMRYRKSEKKRAGFLNQKEEVEQAAHWSKEYLIANPNAQIGCIVNDLPDAQEEIKYIFDRVFIDQKEVINISMGKIFSSYPIIHSALLSLKLNDELIDLNAIRFLLYSPFFIANEQEMVARAHLLDYLSAQGVNEIPINFIKDFSKKKEAKYYTPNFSSALDDFLSMKLRGLHFPSDWSDIFAKQLNRLGWATSRKLNGEEYQLVKRFWTLLLEFVSLDDVLGKINLTMALLELKVLAQNTIFQTKSIAKPQIHILGALEASGIEFDAVWVLGLSHKKFPTRPSPNAFMPIQMQKALGMPHASPERELAFSQTLLERFLGSANEVILSYSRTFDEIPALPSALIEHIPEVDIELISLNWSDDFLDGSSRYIEYLLDDVAPSITKGEKVRGGVGIFQEQAACPFKAFAKFRLKAGSFEESKLGLNVLERGILIHEVLEKIWGVIENQEKLLSFPEEKLNGIISQIIDVALEKIIKKKPLLLKDEYTILEKKRIKTMLLNWFEVEKTREPFEVIETEKSREIDMGQVNLNVKLDRLDRLSDGSYAIIDYKTGKCSPNDWLGERPDAPQLPFYWSISREPVNTLAFAQIGASAVTFKGISRFEKSLPNVKTFEKTFSRKKNEIDISMGWETLKKDWKEKLNNLFEDFCQGDARVDPKKVETCQRCDLQTLCRVHE